MKAPYKIEPQDDQTMNPDDWNQAEEYMSWEEYKLGEETLEPEEVHIYMKQDPIHILSMVGFELYSLEQALSEDKDRVDIQSALNSAQRGIAQAIDMIEEGRANVKA